MKFLRFPSPRYTTVYKISKGGKESVRLYKPSEKGTRSERYKSLDLEVTECRLNERPTIKEKTVIYERERLYLIMGPVRHGVKRGYD